MKLARTAERLDTTVDRSSEGGNMGTSQGSTARNRGGLVGAALGTGSSGFESFSASSAHVGRAVSCRVVPCTG